MARIFLICVDGADWNLLMEWVYNGKLPNFAYLIRRGCSGTLHAVIPPISPIAWTSIFTGTNPGKHGILSFVKLDKSHTTVPISMFDTKVDPIWRITTRHKKRGIFLNIPFAYPPEDVNYIMTTGLGTPSKNSPFTYPSSLKHEILKISPEYNVDFMEETLPLLCDGEKLGRIRQVEDAQLKVAKYLITRNQESLDLFTIVFRSLDVVQHLFFRNEKIVLDCYQAIDKFLGWLVDNVDLDHDHIIICSDHGFKYAHTNVYINNYLKNRDLLKRHAHVKGLNLENIFNFLLAHGSRDILKKLQRSSSVRLTVARLLRLIPFVHSDFSGHATDWENTVAYLLDGSFGILTLNDNVRKNKERSKLLKRLLIKDLLKLRDPKTGNPPIRGVYDGEDLYSGPFTPDVVLLSNRGYTIMSGYNKYQDVFTERKLPGDHDIDGVFIMCGPDVEAKTQLSSILPYDITPTILHLLSIPIPKYMDGRVLPVCDAKMQTLS